MAGNQGKGGGRPTKYRAEYSTKQFRNQYIEYCKVWNHIVTLCGLAVYIGVCEETIQEWGRKHKKFSVSCREIMALQKAELLNKGLLGDYNSTIAKLMLSSNHGMAEKTETIHGLSEATVSLLGLIDGSSKGTLPDKKEAEDG